MGADALRRTAAERKGPSTQPGPALAIEVQARGSLRSLTNGGHGESQCYVRNMPTTTATESALEAFTASPLWRAAFCSIELDVAGPGVTAGGDTSCDAEVVS